MRQRTTRINPSEQTFKIGPVGIRFLLTGNDSNGSALGGLYFARLVVFLELHVRSGEYDGDIGAQKADAP